MDRPAFVEHCVELLAPQGPVSAKRMFGGWGVYVDGLFIALIAADRLYLKVDADAMPVFRAAGCEPFCYDSQGHSTTLGYWSAPDDAIDSPTAMQPWARLALRAAVAARAAKPRRALKPKPSPARASAPRSAAAAKPAPATPGVARRRRSGGN